MKQFSFDWWIELGIATGFGMVATGVSGNITVGLIATYAFWLICASTQKQDQESNVSTNVRKVSPPA